MSVFDNKGTLVTVITPVFNGGDTLKTTIESVLSQTYPLIEYIVIDGGSSDGTIDLVKSFGDKISLFISEPDEGMYDALAKGLKKANGEIICYVNSGDFLYRHAVQLAANLFSDKNILWLTGCRSVCNEKGDITHVDLPFRYKRSLIKAGSYGESLPFIQQESTFWRSSLLECIDFEYLKKLKLAGDYYLWRCFSERTDLEIISSPLGVFRKHTGQLSEAITEYRFERDKFTNKRSFFIRLQEIFELFFWCLHPKVRAVFFRTAHTYDHNKKTWAKNSE